MPGSSEKRFPRGVRILALAGLLTGLALPGDGRAQLISPGKLSRAHEDLEGMANCTECHHLRTPGADRSRCMNCHESLGRRIERGTGYHGTLQTKDCGTCHKEHLGEDFALVRMDPDTFPHSSTGYRLDGAHTQVDCLSCHNPDLVRDPKLLQELSGTGALTRTYLGLDRQCGSCHQGDDPHQGQFAAQDCSACHAEVEWETAPSFRHDRTSYRLEGLHREVECGECHNVMQPGKESALIRYAPLDASDCRSCHDDPHEGRMQGRCGACHAPAGWNRVDRSRIESDFDHETTDYSLVGAHAQRDCRACHSPTPGAPANVRIRFTSSTAGRSYPTPEHETCSSCHLDSHEGVFEERACDACHSNDSWVPPDYDRARHRMELRFELSGSHAVTPCSACHEKGAQNDRRLVFRFDDPGSCSVCHRPDDPHEEAFRPTGCDLCHETDAFLMDRFDHALLDEVDWAGSCVACHESDDPHGGQFQDMDCRKCHETSSYGIPDFDHETSRFSLEGAHARVPCGECHSTEDGPEDRSMIRYRPLDQSCTACHRGDE